MNDEGGLIGIVLLIALVVVVLFVSTSSNTIAPAVQYEYQRCMAAVQTVADQKACDPTAPTATPR